MSGTSGEGAFTTTKATTSEAPSGPTLKDQQAAKENAAALEEDDEFEDFPVDGTLTSPTISSSSLVPLNPSKETARPKLSPWRNPC